MAVREQSSSKIMLMVKSRCERLSGRLLTPPRRAGKKPISSPVVHMSAVSPPSHFLGQQTSSRVAGRKGVS